MIFNLPSIFHTYTKYLTSTTYKYYTSISTSAMSMSMSIPKITKSSSFKQFMILIEKYRTISTPIVETPITSTTIIVPGYMEHDAKKNVHLSINRENTKHNNNNNNRIIECKKWIISNMYYLFSSIYSYFFQIYPKKL